MCRDLATEKTLDGVVATGRLCFGYTPADHHVEMLTAITDARTDQEHTMVLMPAGSAKSTWGNTIHLSHLIGVEPDIQIGLYSESEEFSEGFSRAIQRVLEENDEYRFVFGDIARGPKWTMREWIRKGSKAAQSQNLTVLAGGTDGQVASKRFDVILGDDLLGKSNTKTEGQRVAVREWFDKSLMPRLKPGGVFIGLGTRWEPGDLYETMTASEEDGGWGYRHLIQRALIEAECENDNPHSPDMPVGTKCEHGAMKFEPGPGGHPGMWFTSYWPGWFTIEELYRRRKGKKAAFDCSYNNDVGGLLSGDIFQKIWYRYYGTPGGDPMAELPRADIITVRMGVDFAASLRSRADFTGRITSAEASKGFFYVMREFRDRINAGHAEFIKTGFEEYELIRLVVADKNATQSAFVQDVINEYPQIPIVGRDADVDKLSRATAVAEKYKTQKVFHHASLKDGLLEREQLAFKREGNSHDDLIDAEGYSMDMGGGSFFFGVLARR